VFHSINGFLPKLGNKYKKLILVVWDLMITVEFTGGLLKVYCKLKVYNRLEVLNVDKADGFQRF
jgi:hypothetical protein